jgi:hypothetical protein
MGNSLIFNLRVGSFFLRRISNEYYILYPYDAGRFFLPIVVSDQPVPDYKVARPVKSRILKNTHKQKLWHYLYAHFHTPMENFEISLNPLKNHVDWYNI